MTQRVEPPRRRAKSDDARPLPQDYGRDDHGGPWGGEVGYGFGGEDRQYGTDPQKPPESEPDRSSNPANNRKG